MMCIMQTLRVVLFESRSMLAHLALFLDTDGVQPDCGAGFGRLEVGGGCAGALVPRRGWWVGVRTELLDDFIGDRFDIVLFER